MTVETSLSTIQWREAAAPDGAVDQPGSVETIGDTSFTHRYAEGGNIVWHCVEAGDSGPVVLFVHGYPESWFAWHHQMAFLARDFRCVAIDLPGYGQSEKPAPDEYDYDYRNVARSLAALLDNLDIGRFMLVAHDRGAVVADNLCAEPGLSDRIVKYARMQQSGCEPHGEPRPPHELFRSPAAVEAFRDPANVVQDAYVRNPIVAYRPDDADLARMEKELAYPGVAEGAAASFKSADFDAEHADRMARLFPAMTMPVLFLQGALDRGQSPAEFAAVTDHVANGTLQFVDAGHFLHLERPDRVSHALHAYLTYHPA